MHLYRAQAHGCVCTLSFAEASAVDVCCVRGFWQAVGTIYRSSVAVAAIGAPFFGNFIDSSPVGYMLAGVSLKFDRRDFFAHRKGHW